LAYDEQFVDVKLWCSGALTNDLAVFLLSLEVMTRGAVQGLRGVDLGAASAAEIADCGLSIKAPTESIASEKYQRRMT
jgi:hypothetical protein